eukprot:Plantae.Rhodophyta-Hildenbrandia_rubra.ctg5963.p1 GENE.Plantae.Rhodophyta-Hildenbrandia_rubra.ctg5963~~Plantae.Rhodophyta-Hildenbrandia_rubra.ctg5963.p1  ORF type:complete len:404 (+),score=41.10 Plantae.Rhodophyta-Hildenbrandia_rubra.ctg5963:978-2189(+)
MSISFENYNQTTHPTKNNQVTVGSDACIELNTSFTSSFMHDNPKVAPTPASALTKRNLDDFTESSVSVTSAKKRKSNDWSVSSLVSSCADMMSHAMSNVTDQDTFEEGEEYVTDDILEKREAHNIHTRRCRARHNERLHVLVSLLPEPPIHLQVKTKTECLNYVITNFKSMQSEITSREYDLALTSKKNLREWIDEIAKRSANLEVALRAVVELLCAKTNAVYGDLWRPIRSQSPIDALLHSNHLEHVKSYSKAEGWLEKPMVSSNNDIFGESYLHITEDFVNNVFATLRPVLTAHYETECELQRRSLVFEKGLSSCLAIPVIIFGRVLAVLSLYTTSGAVLQISSDVALDTQLEGALRGPNIIAMASKIISGISNAMEAELVQRNREDDSITIHNAIAQLLS